jgi:hypothetical protein
MQAPLGMRIDLDFEELDTLRNALNRAIKMTENELVHTEAPRLQHAIAADYERLQRLRDLIAEQSAPYSSPPERIREQILDSNASRR